MKKVIIGVVLVIAVFAGLIALGQSSKPQANSSDLTFATVTNDSKNGAKFYDVRTPQEYADGHFEGAVNWSLQDMQAGKLPDVPKDTKIYVHCQSGNRSGQATTILQNAGYTNVIDLGGLSDVEAIGGKLITN